MKRQIYINLVEWKNNKEHKPLIILGARQVGKTYIIKEFRSFVEHITETLDEDKQYRLALRYKKVVPVKPNPVTFYFENHK